MRRIRTPAVSAPLAASASSRSIGTCPTPAKNIRDNLPLMPGVVKYSALARKVTRRLTISGMKKESQKERWLLARIAPPVSGTFSAPSTYGRQIAFSHGPSPMVFRNQYSTQRPPAQITELIGVPRP